MKAFGVQQGEENFLFLLTMDAVNVKHETFRQSADDGDLYVFSMQHAIGDCLS